MEKLFNTLPLCVHQLVTVPPCGTGRQVGKKFLKLHILQEKEEYNTLGDQRNPVAYQSRSVCHKRSKLLLCEEEEPSVYFFKHHIMQGKGHIFGHLCP